MDKSLKLLKEIRDLLKKPDMKAHPLLEEQWRRYSYQDECPNCGPGHSDDMKRGGIVGDCPCQCHKVTC